MKKDGIDMEDLVSSAERLVYVSPSHQFPTGYIMPIGRRNKLLNWAQTTDSTIIEDDYDSEFRYYGRPLPALKGLDTRGNVVYLGSFSKIIPPSIRISYMVLPEKLLTIYQKKSSLYNQAASTIEQLTLAQFMADGHLERQIRRLRKLYFEKKWLFFDAIKNILGENVQVNENESGLHTILTIKSESQAKELGERALKQGCRVAPVEDYYLEVSPEKLPQIILYFSKIPAAQMKTAIRLLKDAWF
jgi:GntR family transcriptional regulator/MocR family aminotransferase